MLWLVARGFQGSKAGNAPTCLRGNSCLTSHLSACAEHYLLEKLPQFNLCSPSLFVTYLWVFLLLRWLLTKPMVKMWTPWTSLSGSRARGPGCQKILPIIHFSLTLHWCPDAQMTVICPSVDSSKLLYHEPRELRKMAEPSTWLNMTPGQADRRKPGIWCWPTWLTWHLTWMFKGWLLQTLFLWFSPPSFFSSLFTSIFRFLSHSCRILPGAKKPSEHQMILYL